MGFEKIKSIFDVDYGFNRIILESVQIKCLISLPPGDLSLPIFAEAPVRLRYLKCKRDGSFSLTAALLLSA